MNDNLMTMSLTTMSLTTMSLTMMSPMFDDDVTDDDVTIITTDDYLSYCHAYLSYRITTYMHNNIVNDIVNILILRISKITRNNIEKGDKIWQVSYLRISMFI